MNNIKHDRWTDGVNTIEIIAESDGTYTCVFNLYRNYRYDTWYEHYKTLTDAQKSLELTKGQLMAKKF